MEGCWSGAVKKDGAKVEVTARAIRQMPAVKPMVDHGDVWQGSRVAEAAVQDEATDHECDRGGSEEDMPASEEGIPSEDGAACLQGQQLQRQTPLCGWQSRMSWQQRGC